MLKRTEKTKCMCNFFLQIILYEGYSLMTGLLLRLQLFVP